MCFHNLIIKDCVQWYRGEVCNNTRFQQEIILVLILAWKGKSWVSLLIKLWMSVHWTHFTRTIQWKHFHISNRFTLKPEAWRYLNTLRYVNTLSYVNLKFSKVSVKLFRISNRDVCFYLLQKHWNVSRETTIGKHVIYCTAKSKKNKIK